MADTKISAESAATSPLGLFLAGVQSGGNVKFDPTLLALVMTQPLNMSIAAAVAGNALTVSVKGADGNDPSSTNPVYIPFRSATAATGSPVVRTLTAALSVTVPNTALAGFASGVAGRLWCVAFDDAGTVRLGVINCREGTDAAGYTIYPLEQFGIASSSTVGTGSDSARTFYSDTGVTSKAYTVLGYVDISAATAGVWASAPTKVVTFGPGVKLPGERVQSVAEVSGAYVSCSTTMPYDDTVPQNTEGTQVFSKSLTPSSGANILRGYASLNAGTPSSAENVLGAIFRDSTASAIAANIETTIAANTQAIVNVDFEVVAGSTSSTTFNTRLGGGTTTINFNGVASARKLGGAISSKFIVEEIVA